jgi:uncharacterized membrane protein
VTEVDEPRNTGDDIGRALREAASVASKAIASAGEAAAAALQGTFGGHASHDTTIESGVLAHVGHADPASAGRAIQVRVHIENPGDTATEPFKLTALQLKAGKTGSIPASAVDTPDHQRVLAAKSSDTVPVTVNVPKGTKPGTYTGKLKGGPQPAELSVVVG